MGIMQSICCKLYGKNSTVRFIAFKTNLALHKLHIVPNNIKAQARTRNIANITATVKGFKQLLFIFW